MRSKRGLIVGLVLLLVFIGVGCSDSDDDGNQNARDTGVSMDVKMDVPDGDPMCEPVAIPCCNESGERVTYAQCTFQGLQCPAGVTEMNCYDGGTQMDGGDAQMDGGDVQTDGGGDAGG